MLKTQMMLFDEDPVRSDDKSAARGGNQYHLYGLQYNQFQNIMKGRQGPNKYSTNIDQLHSQLVRERQTRIMEQDPAKAKDE